MNTAITIIKNLPMLLKSGKLIALFVLTIAFIFGAIGLSYYLIDSQTKAEAVGKELSMISSYMSAYKKKEGELNNVAERPVDVKDIDSVQTEVLLLMQSTEIQIMDLKVVKDSGTKESQSVVYKANEKTTAGEKEAAKAAGNTGNAEQKTAKRTQEENKHRSYDVKLKGRYENLMAFIQKFGVKGKLLTIRKFSISPMDDGNYIADVRYKIYVK